jgi:hypothetical protein
MFVTGGYQCVQNDIAQMQSWLDAGSPMAIQISLTEQFYDYSDPTLAATTVYPYDSTASESVVIGNHAMEIVGYGVLNGVNYWKLKNSWGVSWGDNGYLMIQQGFGGIESQACTPNPVCPSSAPSRFATSALKQVSFVGPTVIHRLCALQTKSETSFWYLPNQSKCLSCITSALIMHGSVY